MSKISLKPNASGTGNFTIEAPNSNVDRTLSLPDEAGTVLTSSSTVSGTLVNSQTIADTSNHSITSSAGVFNSPSSLQYTPLLSNSTVNVFCFMAGYLRRSNNDDNDTRGYIRVGTVNSSGGYDYFGPKEAVAVGESNFNSRTEFIWYTNTEFGTNVARDSSGDISVAIFGRSDEDPGNVQLLISSSYAVFMEFA